MKKKYLIPTIKVRIVTSNGMILTSGPSGGDQQPPTGPAKENRIVSDESTTQPQTFNAWGD